MQDETDLSPAERELAEALGRLMPAASHIDHDALIYRAGRASMGRQMYTWRVVAATLAVALGCASMIGPAAPIGEKRIVQTPPPESALPPEASQPTVAHLRSHQRPSSLTGRYRRTATCDCAKWC